MCSIIYCPTENAGQKTIVTFSGLKNITELLIFSCLFNETINNTQNNRHNLNSPANNSKREEFF